MKTQSAREDVTGRPVPTLTCTWPREGSPADVAAAAFEPYLVCALRKCGRQWAVHGGTEGRNLSGEDKGTLQP